MTVVSFPSHLVTSPRRFMNDAKVLPFVRPVAEMTMDRDSFSAKMGAAMSLFTSSRDDSADPVSVRELELFATNDGSLYRSTVRPILSNLARKIIAGSYDHTKALKLWRHLADEACRLYNLRHGNGRRSVVGFSPATRDELANALQIEYQEELDETVTRLKRKDVI